MKQPEDKINEEWNDDEKRQIGNRISQLRRDKGMNQSELAEILGITVNSVSNMENGNTVAKSKRLLQISEIFEVSVDYILKGEDKINKIEHIADRLNSMTESDLEKCMWFLDNFQPIGA